MTRIFHLFLVVSLILVIDGFSGAVTSHELEKVKTHEACHLPEGVGHCNNPQKIPRFYYNTSTQSCLAFNFDGCNENDNNFKTMDDCRQLCEIQSGQEKSDENDKNHGHHNHNEGHHGHQDKMFPVAKNRTGNIPRNVAGNSTIGKGKPSRAGPLLFPDGKSVGIFIALSLLAFLKGAFL